LGFDMAVDEGADVGVRTWDVELETCRTWDVGRGTRSVRLETSVPWDVGRGASVFVSSARACELTSGGRGGSRGSS
jgi:hypothetical protein